MKIQYMNESDFYNGVQEMLQRGIKFKAEHNTLTIELTGGF